MQYNAQSTSHRRGAVAPLTAVLIVFILGMVAFAVDMGYIVQTKEELESAADSAAMAGAGKLMDYEVQYYFSANQPALATPATQSATSEAQKFGQKNKHFHRLFGQPALAEYVSIDTRQHDAQLRASDYSPRWHGIHRFTGTILRPGAGNQPYGLASQGDGDLVGRVPSHRVQRSD